MPPLGDTSPVTFVQLGAGFTLMLWLVLFAAMGAVDGLKFRRIRLRYGVVILATLRGLPAQIVGSLCVLAELGGLGLLVVYVELLALYCRANAGCLITTPVVGLFANWVVVVGNALAVACFILWLRARLGEVSAPSDALSFSLPSVHRFVNGKLALAHEHPMNRPEVERVMEFVEQHAQFVVLAGAKQVMDGKRLDPGKLAGVFLTDKEYRGKGERVRIALQAVTEAYVVSRQSSETPGSRK